MTSPNPSKPPKKPNPYAEYTPYFSLLMRVGIGMIVSILIWLGIGIGLEHLWPMNGKIILGCVLMGVLGGFYLTYRQLMKLL